MADWEFYSVMILTVTAVVVLSLVLGYVIFPAIYDSVTRAVDHTNDEYEYYVGIRDFSNCTKENDTYCVGKGGCVHAYEACQLRQCGVVR